MGKYLNEFLHIFRDSQNHLGVERFVILNKTWLWACVKKKTYVLVKLLTAHKLFHLNGFYMTPEVKLARTAQTSR